MKKWLCMILAVLLVLGVSGVAFALPHDPSGLDEVICGGLPSGEKLYKIEEYSAGSAQYEQFNEYMIQNSMQGTLDHVWELAVWDEHNTRWVDNATLGNLVLAIQTEAGFKVLHNSVLSGGIEELGNSADFQSTTGAGLFGFVQPDSPVGLDEIACGGLPSGEKLYKRAAYTEGSAQYNQFKDYMANNNMQGTLDRVWELQVWDEHLMEWISNSQFADVPLTISAEAGFKVLHSSVLSGGIEELGNSASFVSNSGAGLFAFVQPDSPAGLEEIACGGLPSGEKLYKRAEYGAGTAQYDQFKDYMSKNNMQGTPDYVWELQVWDEHLMEWISNSQLGGMTLTIQTAAGYKVLHSSALSGGIEQLGNSASFVSQNGAGLFAFVKQDSPAGLEEIICAGLPSGEKLYKRTEYGAGTAQYDQFKDYMSKNNIQGTLDHVWELQVWDEHLMEWIPNSQLGDMTLTIQTAAGFKVLHSSALSGGIEQLGDSASFVSKTGAGLFAFVKPPIPPTTDGRKAPKTGDDTFGMFGMMLLIAAATTGLSVGLKRLNKAGR